jgi:hypothetical protein
MISTMPFSVYGQTPNVMRYVQGEPAAEPATLVDVKLVLRQDGSDDDALITRYIKAARVMAESYCNRAFINRSIEVWWDGFPSVHDVLSNEVVNIPAVGIATTRSGNELELPLGPWSAATLQLINDVGTATDVNTAVYFLDPAAGRLCLRNGQTWPATTRDRQGVKLNGTIGYGAAAANMPGGVVTAIEMLAAQLYQSKGGCDTGVMPTSVAGLLNPFRKVSSFGCF